PRAARSAVRPTRRSDHGSCRSTMPGSKRNSTISSVRCSARPARGNWRSGCGRSSRPTMSRRSWSRWRRHRRDASDGSRDRGGASPRRNEPAGDRRRLLRAHPRPRRPRDLHLPARGGGGACARGEARGRSQHRSPALRRTGRGQGQYRHRGPADHRRLPGLRLPADGGRDLRRPPRARRRHRRRQDQSRSIRDRFGRRASALRHPAQPVQSGADSGWLELGLGGRGRRRARAAGARHRHRRLRPGAGRVAEYRRPQAERRPGLGRGRGAGVPHARLRIGAGADGRRCLRRACRDGRPRCRRSLSAPAAPAPGPRPRGGGRGAPPPAGARLGAPKLGQRLFFGDAASAAAYAAALARLDALGAAIVEIDIEPFYEAARLLYEGPWLAERYLTARALIASAPESLHPVTRQIILGGAHSNAADAFAAFYRLEELRRVRDHAFRTIDALVLPTVPTVYTIDEVLADPVGLNSRLGTYTNFLNPLDLCALSV